MRALASALVPAILLGLPTVTVQAEDDKPPIARILRLIGPDAQAHACPVTPHIAITAAHAVAYPDPDRPPRRFRFESVDRTVAGTAEPLATSNYVDTALLQLSTAATPYPPAASLPTPGSRVYWIGFDYGNAKDFMRPERYSGKVVRTVAGHIVIDTASRPGTSGSCVLNESGEVVGILVWGMATDGAKELSIAVGIGPPWTDHQVLLDAEAQIVAHQ